MKNYILILIFLLGSGRLNAQEDISSSIADQLVTHNESIALHYPASVKRFYLANGFTPVWIKSQDGMGPTWQAMLMLDCVLQFGLSHGDYHPNELSYDTLHTIFEDPEKLSYAVKARFEIMLTDAMISFMNHLHFGQFNPDYVRGRIDEGKDIPFLADRKLMEALKSRDLMTTVLEVQPKSAAYRELQAYMRLAKGQYTNDCYEIPEDDIRLAAINMERLRWVNLDQVPFLHINIPSYTLQLHEADSVYSFKVVVGKPKNPTPILQSAIGHFTTAPDWKVPHKIFIKELLPKALVRTTYFEEHKYAVYDVNGMPVAINSVRLKEISRNPGGYSLRQSSGCDNALGAVVFRFPNNFDVYLHDSPEQKLFDREIRSLSHGCIRVQNATELASLLLHYDGNDEQIPALKRNVKKYLKDNFMLKTPLPIRVTYLTCTVNDGKLKRFKDIYHLDKLLENKLYHIQEQIAFN